MSDHSSVHSYLRVLIVFFAMQLPACHPRTEGPSMAQRFEALSRMERATLSMPELQRIAVIGAGYDQMVAPVHKSQKLDGVDDKDLEALYRAAQLAALHSHDPAHVRDMALFLNGLQERGLASKPHYTQMYQAFIGARMLAEADALARQHPMSELEVLPELRDAIDAVPGRPTEWVVNPNKRELLHQSVDLHQPVEVVVVSHPLCHFSRDAMRDIQADPVLREVFEAHAKWLAPQDNHIYFDTIQEWNRQHPRQEIALAFRREEWPMFDTWSTPTFYFLKNGEVTAKVEGWPKQGRRSELIAALQQVGILQ